jgi:hypothetical protein
MNEAATNTESQLIDHAVRVSEETLTAPRMTRTDCHCATPAGIGHSVRSKRTKSIVLDFKEPVEMAEWVRTPLERQGLRVLGNIGSSFNYCGTGAWSKDSMIPNAALHFFALAFGFTLSFFIFFVSSARSFHSSSSSRAGLSGLSFLNESFAIL